MTRGALLLLSGGSHPPIPTRDQLCTAQTTFQGPMVQTQQWGLTPWFQPALAWLTGPTAQADRLAAYRVLRSFGDNMGQLAVSSQYGEGGQFYQSIPGRDFSQDLPALQALCWEVVSHLGMVDLRLAGDGQGAGPGYNDPGGMTYGHDWLMANFARIVYGLKQGNDVTPYIRWCPAYDAWFYGWTPQQVANFGALFRQVLPQGVLCGEFQAGICHLGNGKADYLIGGGLYNYDLFQSEYNMDNPPEYAGNARGHNDTLYQIGARLLGPAYVRPSDQHPEDDPGAPFGAHSPNFYLSEGTNRGPYYTSGYEDLLYYLTRTPPQATPQDCADYRAYKQLVGYSIVG